MDTMKDSQFAFRGERGTQIKTNDDTNDRYSEGLDWIGQTQEKNSEKPPSSGK